MSKSNHYVNNAEFLKAMIEYKALVKEAEDSGQEKPVISNYIAETIMTIARRLSYSPNFINYSYRDDMVLDGIENCLKYIDNFDASISPNPFSYFTQINYYAFVRRIKKENDQAKLKQKMVLDMPFEAFELQDHDEEGHFTNSYIEFMQQFGSFDKVINDKKQKKPKKKSKDATLEEFE